MHLPSPSPPPSIFITRLAPLRICLGLGEMRYVRSGRSTFSISLSLSLSPFLSRACGNLRINFPELRSSDANSISAISVVDYNQRGEQSGSKAGKMHTLMTR